ncbi:MAG: response regulator, partial [Lachnospiraceae bacterium]|nr:response regulator [Lachnospiraceae bacterium]
MENMDAVVVVFHYSVVVKGIERKLNEMGYSVFMITENLDKEFLRFVGGVRLAVLYLPSDIMEDQKKKELLSGMLDAAVKKLQRTLVIGEKKFHDDLLNEFPVPENYTLLDRPVDMGLLEKEMNKTADQIVVIKESTRKRILIVDDDPSYSQMVKEWIKDRYRVDIVNAGMQAITFLVKVPENEKVDMILLDYEMPVVDGPQVLQMLRQEPATAHIPV